VTDDEPASLYKAPPSVQIEAPRTANSTPQQKTNLVTFLRLGSLTPVHSEREGTGPGLQPSIGFECTQLIGGQNEHGHQQIVDVGKKRE
jgi:hypothetical protein